MSTHPNILSRDGLLLPAGSAGVADNHTSDAKRCDERVVAAVQKREGEKLKEGSRRAHSRVQRLEIKSGFAPGICTHPFANEIGKS